MVRVCNKKYCILKQYFCSHKLSMLSLNINKKMILAIGLVSIIALSITALLTFSIVILTIEEKTKDQLVSESIIQGETIQEFLNLKIQQVQNLAKNQLIQKSINDVNRLEDESLFKVTIEEKRLDFLDKIHEYQNNLDHSLELEDLQILGQNGKTYFSLSEETDENNLSPIYDSERGVKAPLIEFNISSISNNGNAIISVPVFVSETNIHSEPMGTIIATVDILEINQILRKPFKTTESDQSFLINNDELIILKSRSDENNSSSMMLNTIPTKMCFDEGLNYYGKYSNSANKQVYGFSYCLTNFNLALLTEIDESEILSPITKLQQAFFFIGIIIIAGVGIVSVFLSKSISKPIMKLKDAADEIANGNFDTRSNIKSGDEIEQLSISFDAMAVKIQESLKKIKQRDKIIKEQQDLLLEFSENKQKCCVGVIDIVNSTKITANLSDKDTRNFYGIFINFMASIVKEFEGIVVKNIGDALLFYFPETNRDNIQHFENAINCCMMMIDSYSKINDKMDEKGLSSVSYRISAVYGSIMIAQMSTSSVVDIFGSTVNVCTKINSLAQPNKLVIEGDLYNIIKSSEKFVFKQKTEFVLNDKTKIKVYSVENNPPTPKSTLSYSHSVIGCN